MNKMREQLADSFIAALKEDRIPWEQTWSDERPYNAVTGKKYTKTNSFWLTYVQEIKGYSDSRWCTFNQARSKGWQIKKGEKGTLIEFFSLYDTEQKRKLTQQEAEELRKKLGAEYDLRVKIISKTNHVFNAEQIIGIPEREKRETPHIQELMRKRTILLSNMGVVFLEKGNQCFYQPENDTITLPKISKFTNDYSYIATLYHEAAHATGHKSRLNRDLSGVFGSENYAKEELRAEIASTFVAQEIGVKELNTERNIENHKAYVQSWISILENNPNELFSAIKDADLIAEYLIEKSELFAEQKYTPGLTVSMTPEEKEGFIQTIELGLDYSFEISDEDFALYEELIKERAEQQLKEESTMPISKNGALYYTEEQGAFAERVKLIDYLDSQKIPYKWQNDGTVRLIEHSSFVLSPQEDKWKWFSRDIGGIGAYQYLRKVEGKTAVEAVLMLNGELGSTEIKQYPFRTKFNTPEVKPKQEFQLPAAAENNKRVMAYLIQTRKIEKNLVYSAIHNKLLYEDAEHHNAVFVGYDHNNEARYAAMRGTYTKADGTGFRREVAGSRKEYGFKIGEESNTLYVFESPIDVLSYKTLCMKRGISNNNTMLSCGGVTAVAVKEYLRTHPEINNVVLCFDNDLKGIAAAFRAKKVIEETYPPRDIQIRAEFAWNKDFNEDLVLQNADPDEQRNLNERFTNILNAKDPNLQRNVTEKLGSAEKNKTPMTIKTLVIDISDQDQGDVYREQQLTAEGAYANCGELEV